MSDYLNEKIVQLISPSINDLGYKIVRVSLDGTEHKILQIMIENTTGNEITIDDCAKVSRTVSTLLDVEDPIHSAYDLEVSSPGIDRSLVSLEDYIRFVGFEVKIELHNDDHGITHLKGILANVDQKGLIEMNVANSSNTNVERIFVEFAEVKDAKLVLTNRLIAASQNEKL